MSTANTGAADQSDSYGIDDPISDRWWQLAVFLNAAAVVVVVVVVCGVLSLIFTLDVYIYRGFTPAAITVFAVSERFMDNRGWRNLKFNSLFDVFFLNT